MNVLTALLVRLFDRLQAFANSEGIHAWVGRLLILYFLALLALTEADSLGWLPPGLARCISLNRFEAVTQTFTLVLVLEVVDLVFSLPRSTSRSVGKQFEIFALILLRDAFKELEYLPVPIEIAHHTDVILELAANGAGALVVFILLGAYNYAQRCAPKHWAPEILAKFITAKKLVALVVLAAFACMGVAKAAALLRGGPDFDIFDDFYTLLIFTDILILLIAQRYMPQFHAIFRNSGFALSTLFIRLALTSKTLLGIVMGVGAMVFALCLTYASNRFYAVTEGGPSCHTPSSRK